MAIGLGRYWPSRPDAAASYAIPVRRAGTLPAASFRSRLSADTLAVRLSVPITRVRKGLAPPSHQSVTTTDWMALPRHAPCLAHQTKSRAISDPAVHSHAFPEPFSCPHPSIATTPIPSLHPMRVSNASDSFLTWAMILSPFSLSASIGRPSIRLAVSRTCPLLAPLP